MRAEGLDREYGSVVDALSAANTLRNTLAHARTQIASLPDVDAIDPEDADTFEFALEFHSVKKKRFNTVPVDVDELRTKLAELDELFDPLWSLTRELIRRAGPRA